MKAQQALRELYRLALFGPGFQGATFANILLRAAAFVDVPTLKADLDGLRDNLAQRQAILQQVHDALAKDANR